MQFILLQESGGSSPYSSLLLIGVMVLVLYLFMIRPQQKRMREQKRYLAALKEGDDVRTSGGIHGKIVSIRETEILLEVDKGTTLTLDRASISYEASKRRR